MAELKTRPTGVAVDGFIDAVPNPRRREDAKTVRALMERLSGETAQMWGPGIVGFGQYHYEYESGREGDMARIGFSPRASELVLYLSADYTRPKGLMDKLGKHRTGKSCLYIKKLSDVDEAKCPR
jgi:hypothetical protein